MAKLVLIAFVFFAAVVNAENKVEGQNSLDVEAELKKLESLQVENPATTAVEAATTEKKEAPAVGVAPAPAKPVAQMKETEIPVNLDQAKKSATADNPWMKMLMSVGVIGIMGCGAFIWMRKNKKTQVGIHPAPEIKVLKMHHLGHKRSLAIVRVAGESILIGVTDQNINHIKTLSLLDEDVPTEVPQNFKSVFNQSQSFEEQTPARQTMSEEDDDFSISGIKDFVSTKLKNMRTLE